MFPSGSKSWRYAFRYLGNRKTLVFGQYPEISLKQARELTAAARVDILEGRDPRALKKEAKEARKLDALQTFEARAWLQEKQAS